MSLAVVHCRACVGIDSPPVDVEVHLSGGLPSFHLVGVPETAVRESKDRVRSALLNCGFKFPARRITVNLAPANVPKEGARFDLAIAIGILAASSQLRTSNLSNYELYGELSLGGELRPFRGALAVAVAALPSNRILVMPNASAISAAHVQGIEIRVAKSLIDVAGYLEGEFELEIATAPKFDCTFQQSGATRSSSNSKSSSILSSNDRDDFSDVRGQHFACRALEIAAAGGHHVLMVGPPGSGKTMLASRLPTILPPLSQEDSLQSATLFDVAGIRRVPSSWHTPVFRSPHHTVSAYALIGGGRVPLPGEVSLAHCGVLFLDELAEFPRHALEVLRQPLEDRQVTISRVAGRFTYPCRFQLVAAMNPCPCGYLNDSQKECRCSPEQISRYQHKISGPLLDRIDLQVPVPRPAINVLAGEGDNADTSAIVRSRVLEARNRQHLRGKLNKDLSAQELTQSEVFSSDARALLRAVADKKLLSARSWFSALKVARTIADLEQVPIVLEKHIAEAANLRFLDGLH